MIKRIHCIIMVLSIMLSGAVGVAAADKASTKSFEQIQELGFFTDIEDASAKMKRTDYNKLTEQILKKNIPQQDDADIYVKCSEAVRFLVDAAGYEVAAEKLGGYPVGYMTVGQRLKLFKGVDVAAAELLTYGQFADILVNAFDVEMYTVDSFENGLPNYSSSSDETFMSEIMEIKRIKGQITSSIVTSIGGAELMGEDEVAVDGVRYLLNENTARLSTMVGYFIEAYVSLADNDENTIVQASLNDKYMIRKIDAADIISYSNYVIRYDKNSDGKSNATIRIPMNANVIYNGKVTGSYTPDMFDIDNGEVVVIYKDSSAVDTVIIKSYQNYVVSGVDYKNKIVYNKLYTGEEDRSLSLDEEEYGSNVRIFGNDGKPYLIEDLKENDVISVVRTDSYVEAYVSTTVLQNVFLEKRMSDDRHIWLVFEGTEYDVSRYFAESPDFYNLEIGRGYTVYIDVFGKIAYTVIRKGSGREQGYFIKAKTYVDEATGETVAAVKVFGSDGTIKTIETANKVKVSDQYGDVKIYKNDAEAVYSVIKSYYGVLWYRLNDEGKINEIECALEKYLKSQPNRTYRMDFKLPSSHYVYKSTARTFGGHHYMTSDVVIYSIPMNIEDYDDYRIISPQSLENNYDYHFDGYSNDEDGVMLNALIFQGQTSSLDIRSNCVVVTKVMDTVNADNELIKRIVGYENGSKVTYDSAYNADKTAFDNAYDLLTGKKEIYRIKKGDIIRCKLDSKKEFVNECQLIFRPGITNPAFPEGQKGALVGSTGKYISNQTDGNPFGVDNKYSPVADAARINSAAYRVYYGWVYKKNGSIMTLTTQDISSYGFVGETDEYRMESYNINSFPRFTTVEYSGDTVEARAGTAEDIRAYKDFGRACSRVIATVYWGEINQLIVIND